MNGNNVYLNIKRTPAEITRQPDRSHMPATAPRAQSGSPIKRVYSTPDFKQSRSLDGKGSPADQGFVTINPWFPLNAYPGSQKYGSKIKRGK